MPPARPALTLRKGHVGIVVTAPQNLVQHANRSSLQERVATLELANRTAEFFATQPASEKRRLLDFVRSKSTWGDGELDRPSNFAFV